MCQLIHKKDPKAQPVTHGYTITDQMGRLWAYEDCIGATEKTPAIVVVRRVLAGDKRATTPTNFALAMFPDYRVSVR